MIDSHLTDQYVKVQDNLYICPSSEGLVYMHNPSHGPLWTKNLASPAINAFDVFRPSFEDPSMFEEPPSLVLIRQPLSPVFNKAPAKVDTFLNTTEEGAWYALSTDRYPLLSHVKPAPWVTEKHDGEDHNLTKEELVGIHPISRQLEMNIDNPGLPAPNMPKLIEGGDWQKTHHGHMHVIKDNPMLFLAALAILILAIWKRRALASVFFRRRTSVVEDIIETPPAEEDEEITIEKQPLLNRDVQDDVVLQEATMDVIDAQGRNDVPPAPDKKPRRKRGQRGGKNNKKKVGFIEPTTDVDEEDQGDEGFAQVASSSAIPKDIPLNDQGNHTIDGLTVTDKLLGSLPYS
jgi:hypothetical protein